MPQLDIDISMAQPITAAGVRIYINILSTVRCSGTYDILAYVYTTAHSTLPFHVVCRNDTPWAEGRLCFASMHKKAIVMHAIIHFIIPGGLSLEMLSCLSLAALWSIWSKIIFFQPE